VSRLKLGPAGQRITISAGIAEFPRHTLGREELMHLADGAMYWAKSAGRNRSCIFTAERDFALSAQEQAARAAREGLVNTVHALAKAVDAKDGYTNMHSHRVGDYAAAIACKLGMDAEKIDTIRTAGVLHDVGKIGISDRILQKPGSLTPEEWAVMRRHSEPGRDIIAGAGMTEIAEYLLHLHERYDGQGYPSGLRADEIPLESRILHVADAIEAMTSSRVYRKAMPVDEALGEVERCAGTQMDPDVCAALLELVADGELEIGEDISEVACDEEGEAVVAEAEAITEAAQAEEVAEVSETADADDDEAEDAPAADAAEDADAAVAELSAALAELPAAIAEVRAEAALIEAEMDDVLSEASELRDAVAEAGETPKSPVTKAADKVAKAADAKAGKTGSEAKRA
jgi:hypothetical protein